MKLHIMLNVGSIDLLLKLFPSYLPCTIIKSCIHIHIGLILVVITQEFHQVEDQKVLLRLTLPNIKCKLKNKFTVFVNNVIVQY